MIKDRLRNWLQVKASAVTPLITWSKIGQAVWTPRNYKKFSEEGYQKSVIVFKAINEYMQGAGQIPWMVQKVNRAGDRVDADDSDLANLLRRPNPYQAGSSFFSAHTGFFKISGNAYMEIVPGARGIPRELYTHRSDRMRVIPGETDILGYEYEANGQKKKFDAQDDLIRHFKTFHPLDDFYGMSPLEAAAYDVDIHTATLEWNKALLDNRCQPSGALMYRPKTGEAYLSEIEFKRLKQELEEHTGQNKGNGKPLLLEGGLEWQQMSLSPLDMDYLNSKNATARDIAIALGVPPQLLGIPGDATYNNMAEARMSLWDNGILPWGYWIRDELNAWLAPKFGDEYRIEIDEDKIMALAPRREALWEKLQNADWLTWDEKRELTGYEPKGGDADKLHKPISEVPVGENIIPEPISPEKATGFPVAGENMDIALKNSAYLVFDRVYAENIRKNHPNIWKLDMSLKGDSSFDRWKAESSEWIKEREKWAQRNAYKHDLSDVVAQMKWGVVNTRGERFMKDLIEAKINDG
jgi:HK97 family phage portal protein